MPTVLYERLDRVAVVTLNRPEAMNALNYETFMALSEAFLRFRDEDDAWVAVLTGAGDRAFSAGADLKAMSGARHPDSWTGPWWDHLHNPQVHRGLELYKPVIAAVNGHCHAGGLNLMLACDIRIAAEHATFSLAQVRRGIIPGNGGTQRLPRELPYAVAMEMLLYGTRMDAATALHHGLINRVVPGPELRETALAYAHRLCSESAPLAVRVIKQAVVRGLTMPLDQAIFMESLLGRQIRETEDAAEGPRAFAEKRAPVWKGR